MSTPAKVVRSRSMQPSQTSHTIWTAVMRANVAPETAWKAQLAKRSTCSARAHTNAVVGARSVVHRALDARSVGSPSTEGDWGIVCGAAQHVEGEAEDASRHPHAIRMQ